MIKNKKINNLKMFFLQSQNNINEEDYEQLEKENETLKQENSLLNETMDRMEVQIKENKIFGNHYILGKKIHQREDGTEIYVSESRRLLPNLSYWEFNRKIDTDHVDSLKKVVKDGISIFEGVIDVLTCDNEFRICNGQHRVKALQELMEEDDSINFELIINVHYVESFDSERSNRIFLATNNTKNIEIRDKPQIKLQNICNRLRDKYPNSITMNKTGKANLHRLDKKQLYNLLQFNDTCNDPNNDEDYLFDKIVKLNIKLSNQSYEELFGSKRQSDRKKKIYDGAIRDGFYLGLKTETQLAILFNTEI